MKTTKLLQTVAATGLVFGLAQTASAVILLAGTHQFESANVTSGSPVTFGLNHAATGVSGYVYVPSGEYDKDNQNGQHQFGNPAGTGNGDGFYGPDAIYNSHNPVPTGQTRQDGAIEDLRGTQFVVTNSSNDQNMSLHTLLFDLWYTKTGGVDPSYVSSLTYQINSNPSVDILTKVEGPDTTNTSPRGGKLEYETGKGVRIVRHNAGGQVPHDFVDALVDLEPYGIVLAPGDTITFTWNSSENKVWLDDIGLTGSLTAIPEPGSALALACLLGSGLIIRNRRR